MNNPWNQDTPLIRTLSVGPKGVRIRGVALYSNTVSINTVNPEMLASIIFNIFSLVAYLASIKVSVYS